MTTRDQQSQNPDSFPLMNDRHSTYALSPRSALIELHVVESIHPAPHVTFYDGLRAALVRIAAIDIGREASGGMRSCVCDRKVACDMRDACMFKF